MFNYVHYVSFSSFVMKLGFGKSMPTTCVWLDGLATSITEQYLTRHFCRYGHVVKVRQPSLLHNV